ncbi:MAG: thioredoxin domain-containing protein, partial [Woeseiaceae bacterium]|nr:thioredoxin domain-containing protein [Woeseiaceae bacterium]
QYAWQAMLEYPHGHATLITALEEYLEHPEIIIVRGDADEIGRWRDAAARLYAPRRLVFAIDASAPGLPGALADRRPVPGQTVAYRCVGNSCSLPLSSFEALAAELRQTQ